jgi:Heterokaryon incompatibility protein (HET)
MALTLRQLAEYCEERLREEPPSDPPGLTLNHNGEGISYEPLCRNEIRLLQISPSSKNNQAASDSPIYCDLQHFPLVEPDSSKKVIAKLVPAKSKWESSDSDLGFQIVGKPQAALQRLKARFSSLKGGHRRVEGRFPWGDFVALSYTWGDARETKEIFINGRAVRVRPNLEAALRVLREKGPIRAGVKVWIDALCINQADTNERNCLVPRMREIYQRA